jgi:hypothetical protein
MQPRSSPININSHYDFQIQIMDLVLRKKSNYFLRAHAQLKPHNSPNNSSDSLGNSTGLIEQVIQALEVSDDVPSTHSPDGLYSNDHMYEIGGPLHAQPGEKDNADANSISLFHRDPTPSASLRPARSLQPDSRHIASSSSSSAMPHLAPKYFTCPSRTTVQMHSNAFCNVEFSFYQTQPILNLHNRHKPWLFNVGIILELTLYEIAPGADNVPVIAVAATTRLELNDKHGPESPLKFTMVAPAFDRATDAEDSDASSKLSPAPGEDEDQLLFGGNGGRALAGPSLVDAFGIGKLCVSSLVRDPVRRKTTFSMKNAAAFVFQPLAKLLHSPSFGTLPRCVFAFLFKCQFVCKFSHALELFPFQEPPTFKFVIIPHFLLNLDTPRHCFLSVKPLSSLFHNRSSRSCTPTTVFPTKYEK